MISTQNSGTSKGRKGRRLQLLKQRSSNYFSNSFDSKGVLKLAIKPAKDFSISKIGTLVQGPKG
jgi:hypothetical protein